MSRVKWLLVAALALMSVPTFAASFTSTQSGDWSSTLTWGGAGVPGSGDNVTITGNHVVTVSDARVANTLSLDTTPSAKALSIGGTGSLTLEGAGTALQLGPINSVGSNTVGVNGGSLFLQNGDVSINGGTGGVSQLFYDNAGGTITIAGDLLFSGTAANALVDFDSVASNATLSIGGDLGNGGTLANLSSTSTVDFNGTGAQTINSYTFPNLKLTKLTGTATLNGAITVSGNLQILNGVLDDGGNQISLNGGGTSTVTIDSNGVLKLGAGAMATTFPSPFASVTLNPNSAVVYQASLAQTVRSDLSYSRLYVQNLGAPVTHATNGPLTVAQDLNISDNGVNQTTLDLGSFGANIDGQISGDGTLSASSGTINIAGDVNGAIAFSAGTSTVVYDGTGPTQSVLGATYHDLTITSTGTASPTGNVTVQNNLSQSGGTFDLGSSTLTLKKDATLTGSFLGSSGVVEVNGTGAQSVSFSNNTLIGTLVVNNASGVSFAGAGRVTVTSALALTAGILTVSSSTDLFHVTVAATISRTSGWIDGFLTLGFSTTPARTFPIGTALSYLPVDVDSGSPGDLTIRAVEGQHPNKTGNNVLNRYWQVSSPANITPIDSITFYYNAGDVTQGTEANYLLAHYSLSTFTHYGNVNTSTKSGSAANVTTYYGDWLLGEPGSLAAASKLAITSINGGSNPIVGQPFNVVVEAQADDSLAADVFTNTSISLSMDGTPTGTLGGTLTGTITAGTSQVTISGVTYDTAETGLTMRAMSTGGDDVADATAAFQVDALSTITVSSLSDSGAGSLRAAITTANSSCTGPCTINFSVNGTIILSSPLPAITAANLTIDGYTAPGASANTNAFGLGSNAVLTVDIDGAAVTGVGLDVQASDVTIKGLALRSFAGGGNSIGVRFGVTAANGTLAGCHIGLDAAGLTSGANSFGVVVDGATVTIIGGPVPADRNIISGNTNHGVHLINSAATVQLAGNYVGTNRTLSGALPNGTGIKVENGTSGVLIGLPGTGNILSGNSGAGLVLAGNGASVRGNIIGTAGSAGTAMANANGIQIDATGTSNTIGSTSPSEINYIGGNTQNGILIDGNFNAIDNNVIGYASDGTTARSNGSSGIRLQGTAASNLIGGTQGNRIANSGADGVSVTASAATGNAIVGNAKIAGNVNLGIDLGDNGATANDGTDSDSGAHGLQNFPTISSAMISGGNVNVTFSLDSSGAPSASFVRFDFYQADASAVPQGLSYLGTSGCLAGDVFLSSVVAVPQGSLTVGGKVVGTATSYTNASCTALADGTSEFSPAVTAGGDIHWIAGNGNWETASNWNPAVVPTVNDNVFIDNGGTYVVSVNSAANANNIQVGTGASGQQTLQINSTFSLNVVTSGTVTTTGRLNVGGTFGGSAVVDHFGTLEWGSGTLTGTGLLNVKAGSTLDILSVSTKAMNQFTINIESGGTANWTGGSITLNNGAGFTNAGTFEIETDSTLSNAGTNNGFTNTGTLRKHVTAGSTSFVGVTLTHSGGNLIVDTGTLNLSDGTISATTSIDGTSVLMVDSNTVTINTGGNVSGTGKIHLTTGGTLTVNGNVSIEHVQMDGGAFNGTGTVNLGGTWMWTGGSMSGTGTTIVTAGQTLTMSGASAKTLEQRQLQIQSSGTFNLGGNGTFNLTNGASIINSGTVDNSSDLTISYGGGSVVAIQNSNLFRKSASVGSTTLSGVSFSNNAGGTLDIQTGTFNPSAFSNANSVFLTGTLLIDSDTALLAGGDVSGPGQLQVTGGTLQVDTNDTIPNFSQTGGIVTGSGVLTLESASWSGGTMQGLGTTSIPGTGTLTITGPSAKSLQRTLAVSLGGVVTVNGGGTINFSGASPTITNNGTFNITVGVVFNNAGAGGIFTNNNDLLISGTGPIQFVGITLDNYDLVQHSGASSIDLADGSSFGTFDLGAGTSLLINSDTYTMSTGATVTGAGTVNLAAGTLSIAGPTVTIPALNMTNGTLSGGGTLSLTGSSVWSGGTMSGAGTTEVANGGTLTLSAGSLALATRALTVVVGGTLNVTTTGTLSLSTGASITNAGTVVITNDMAFSNAGAAGGIVNNGTWSKQTTTGSTALNNINFTNNSLLDLKSGTFTVGGTFTQSVSGTLRALLGGTTVGTQYAQLAVTSGNPTLAGTLDIDLNGPYQPLGGDTFRVLFITGGAHTGDFGTYDLPGLTGGRTWSNAYDASGLLLTVVGTADLTITKTSGATNYVVGTPVVYTLAVTNNGPDAAASVSVTDTLPAGHTGITASGTGWTCNVVSLTVTCTAATLNTGAAPSITINATAPNTPQSFTNTASLTSSSSDPTPANNSSSVNVTIDPNSADLGVTVSGPGSSITAGSNASLVYTIENFGPQNATSTQLTLPVPAGVTYTSSAPALCTLSGGTLTCNLGGIVNTAQTSITINFNAPTPGSFAFAATVDSAEADPTATNDTANFNLVVTGSSLVVTSTNDSGAGSLRQALLDAPTVCTPLPCTISFNIGAGPYVIAPVTPLPFIDDQIFVDGTTQPGYAGAPVIQIDGAVNTLFQGFELAGLAGGIRGLSITGFTTRGVYMSGDNNVLEANYIGLTPSGTSAGNGEGVLVSGINNIIGGIAASQRNVISGNTHGVMIDGTAFNTSIKGNYIGTDPSGNLARPNLVGIEIVDDADNTTIGGPNSTYRNIISGNTNYGIYLQGAGNVVVAAQNVAANAFETVDNTSIFMNWIGPGANGTSSLGATMAGIFVGTNTTFTAIGQNSQGNVISGHNYGIKVEGDGTLIAGNTIGSATDGTTPMANTTGGILINANSVTVGGVLAGEQNYIKFNGGFGVGLMTGTSNEILGNEIHDNTGQGIDVNVDNVATGGDADDSDLGPNGAQTFPTLSSASLIGGGNLNVAFNLNSANAQISVGSFLIEFFEADAGGEGKTWIGRTCQAGNSLNMAFTFAAPAVTAGDLIVATATSYTDNSCSTTADGTSEFSAAIAAATCTPPAVAITGPNTFCTSSAPITLDAGPGFSSYLWTGGATSRTITVSPGSTTTYTVTVTNATGCTNSASHTVTVSTPGTATITGATSTCASTPVTLDAGAGWASYLWTGGATTRFLTVSPAADTTYTVTVSDGICSVSDTHTVTVTSNPTATLTTPASVCANGTGNAAVPAQPGATFAWTVTNGTVTSGAGTNAIVFTAGPSGNVSISVTVTNGSCTSNASATIPITTTPVVTITGPTTACPNTSFTLDAGAGFTSYLWSTGETTRTITRTQSAGSQTYTVTVNGSGCAASDTHTVTLSATPNANISAPSSAEANTSNLNASVAAQAGATYAWSIQNGSITSATNINAITFKTGSSGVTKLTASVTISGCTDTDVRNVTITGSTTVDLSVTKTGTANVQTGGTITYTIGVTNLGSGVASNVVISDIMPAGTTITAFDPGPWTCSQPLSGLHCTGSLGAGLSGNIVITAKAPSEAGSITNTVNVSTSITETDSTNNSASAITLVSSPAPNCPTAAPSLLTPANGGAVTSPVSLSWTAVSGATEYEVWLVQNGAPTLATTTLSTSAMVNAGSGNYSWYVVARGNGCDPLQSASSTFTVPLQDNCSTNAAPQLNAPSGGTLSSPVTFSWSPVPQAIGYRVWVEVDGTAAQDVGTTDGALTLTANIPPGAIVARVDALFNGCPPTTSNRVSFAVREPDPCANRTAATLLSPSNNSVVPSSSLTFAWNAASDADGYRVWISVDGAAPEVLGTTTDETTLTATLERGTVIWWVEALYEGCSSTESQRFTFSIPPAQACNTAKPELLAPANGTTVNNGVVTFQWSAVTGGISYEVWVSLGNGTPALVGTTTQTSLSANVPAGTLVWFVRAYVDRCPSRDSNRSRFTFNEPDACQGHRRPSLISPEDGAVTSPVVFTWTSVPSAIGYDVFVQRGGNAPQLVASTTDTQTSAITLLPGKARWFVRARFASGCPTRESALTRFEVVTAPAACAPMAPPTISAPGQISTGIPFTAQWSPAPGATAYQLQVSSSASFEGAQNITTNTTSHELVRTNNGTTPLAVYLRVRAIDGRCTPPSTSGYGAVAAVFILPKTGTEGATTVNGGILQFTLPIGAEFAGQTFTAVSKHPWLSVTPASGVVPTGGTSLTVTANTNVLPLGASLGGITVTLTSPSAKGVASHATTIIAPGFSVSLVTPVTPTTKSTPPPDALIIPAIAHADGINSYFQSDVRVSNTSPQLMTYELTFTPSGETGITEGRQTTFSVEPGQTIALDDILRTWFGTGSTSTTGSLEIRPTTQSSAKTTSDVVSGLSNLVSFASSRTFNLTSNGTFGQYIPAVPFANFIGKAAGNSSSVLSLQQIAQSSRYRTNLGIVEGSGEPASVLVKIFGDNGQKLSEFPVELKGGQHTQLNSFLANNGVGSLLDGRVELEVTSPGGKITAYASVLDNATSDPLLVTPVTLSEVGNTKWVVPGVADLNNGIANWQTDMRVFNAGSSDVNASFTFYSQTGGEPKTNTVTIPAGQVRQFDRSLATLFNVANDGGAVHITTPAESRLIATARTYNQTSNGTYGQFISAVTPGEAAGTNMRPLQLLQVEESTRFRSNVGLAEVTGNAVTIEIAVVPPDAKFTAVTQLTLQPNEFRQIGSLLSSLGLADTHNARVTVSAIEGAGRVTAYVSVIDLQTNDPTYVPAQ